MADATSFDMAALRHDLPTHSGTALVPRHTAISQAKSKWKRQYEVSLMFHRRYHTAGKQAPKTRPSTFQKLPTELIVLMMCHTRSEDLRHLIQTEKCMHEIFKSCKTWIFHQVQVCQFSEFSGWFGNLPGFDGSREADHPTPEQVQCLRDAVFTCNWRYKNAASTGSKAAAVFLRLLERYGGWRYLHFLHIIKYQVEQAAQNLCRISHVFIPSMNKGLAQAIVLCLSKMSRRATAAAGGDVEELADMPARVKSRVKIFEQEPPALQELILSTLRLLVDGIAKQLALTDIVKRCEHWYQLAKPETATPVPTKEDVHKSMSKIMVNLVLETVFYHGVAAAILLSEKPVNSQIQLGQKCVKRRFERILKYGTTVGSIDAMQEIDSRVKEGSLWAAGLCFSIDGWIQSKWPFH